MPISICFITKQYGVLTTLLDITNLSVFMLIIGKIIEEGQIFTYINQKHVKIGSLEITSTITQKDVKKVKTAKNPMVGKKQNTIHNGLKHNLVLQ